MSNQSDNRFYRQRSITKWCTCDGYEPIGEKS